MIFEKTPELPGDLAKLSEQETKELCARLRAEIIETVTRNGGHLASNLGVVELTVAMYSIFNPHCDRVIWDVGHQSYVHKILTGREEGMALLRHPGGVSGFPKLSESDSDAFNTGHSSTSISAALGYARAFRARGEKRRAIAVIGDGALTGGMAYEALNDAAQSKCNIIVVLNDNGMSIDRNVGGMARYLGKVRRHHSYMRAKRNLQKFLMKAPRIGKPIIKGLSAVKNRFKDKITNGKFFENLGYYYLGPVDGHDVFALKMMFERANEIDGPVLIHVETRKGYGYEPAETNPEDYHGVSCFDAETGQAKSGGVSMSKIFADELGGIAAEDPGVVAVTAAMSKGTGLDAFGEKYPDRLFDVGIAEPHAITMSAGMVLGGLKPVPVIYSTFLQRSYDQLLHDVAMPGIPMVVGIDRAGLTGFDGETHQGLYDFAYLGTLPDVTVAAPSSGDTLREMLRLAMHVYDSGESVIPRECRRLFAVRYPAKERFFHGDAAGFICVPVSYGKGAVVFDSEAANDGNEENASGNAKGTAAAGKAAGEDASVKADGNAEGTAPGNAEGAAANNAEGTAADGIASGIAMGIAEGFKAAFLSIGEAMKETFHAVVGEPESPAVAILSIGEMLEEALAAAERLAARGVRVRVFDARFLRPLDRDGILGVLEGASLAVTVEDAVLENGFGENVRRLLSVEKVQVKLVTLGVKNEPVENDSVDNQLKKYGLKAENIVARVCGELGLSGE